jgi:hypothetical protein
MDALGTPTPSPAARLAAPSPAAGREG